jgi:colanic acid/amylovoran biosynthesis glycosyltransferase
MDASRSLIVYRDELLGASETFILAQAGSLTRFSPFYLGLRRRPGLQVPKQRQHIISGDGLLGKAQRVRFRLGGPSKELVRQLAILKPLLIHAHFGPDGCNAMALAHALGVPLVVSLHGYDVTLADEHHLSEYVRRREALKTDAALFICVSEFIRRQVIAMGFPSSKTVLHYTGIDTDFFTADPKVERCPIVLFVGRLVAKKGCEYLIRAMQEVQKKLPAAELVVIGDGPLRAQLEEQAALTMKNYRFLGAQEPGVVRQWMNRARVLSTPSVIAESGDAEGFGMVFAEAQAMGLPVVSFASGGIPEAVADAETGFLVPERDCNALASRLLMLLTDLELWMQFSVAGQALVRKRFDVRRQTAVLEQLYDRVLGEWKAGTN